MKTARSALAVARPLVHNPYSDHSLSFPPPGRFPFPHRRGCPMVRSCLKKARLADWRAGLSVRVLCAGVVLAQPQAPPPAGGVDKPVSGVADKAEAAPNPKDAAAAALDK